jgi:acetylornithine deacetylase
VEARRDELVALTSDLVGFDTTARHPHEPAREEAALQEHLAGRLRAAGAEVDMWEPAPEEVAGSRQVPPALGFDGRRT